jgi:hypothetical protein
LRRFRIPNVRTISPEFAHHSEGIAMDTPKDRPKVELPDLDFLFRGAATGFKTRNPEPRRSYLRTIALANRL